MTLSVILIDVAVIVASVAIGKPYGWVSLGLAVLSLLAIVVGFRF